MNEPAFDLEALYDEKIAPLMTQIISICKDSGLPMMASFNYRSDPGNEVSYATTSLGRDGWQSEELKEAVAIVRKGAKSRPVIIATITHTP